MHDDHATISQLMFRVPENLHERLEEQALANHRSLNAEVVARLQGSFANTTQPCEGTSEMQAQMKRMEELVQESTTSADA